MNLNRKYSEEDLTKLIEVVEKWSKHLPDFANYTIDKKAEYILKFYSEPFEKKIVESINNNKIFVLSRSDFWKSKVLKQVDFDHAGPYYIITHQIASDFLLDLWKNLNSDLSIVFNMFKKKSL